MIPNAGNMLGIGLVPEGIEQNPVVYSLMLDHVWDNQPIDLDKWLVKYAERRYGKRNKDTEEAWRILKNTAYSFEGNYESIIIARPTFKRTMTGLLLISIITLLNFTIMDIVDESLEKIRLE